MSDPKHHEVKRSLQTTEIPRIIKDTAHLTSDRYKTPKTIPLVFHFEAYPFQSADLRLKDAKIQRHSVESKDIYLFDDFFLDNESQELRLFSTKAEFSRTIFAYHDSKIKGEEPARAMDNKEKWRFFSHPPQAVKEIFKLLSLLAHRLDADIATLPWELYDQDICAPAVATNRIETLSHESMELGKHEDYNTEEGIAFGIPVLYGSKQTYHPNQFVNGDPGKPWLVSLMLYATSEAFFPSYGMGTVFCKKNGQIDFTAEAHHMRFVLFEGDIIHSIEESQLPPDVKPWRISYVFKLIINPKKEKESMKKAFSDLIESYKRQVV